LEASVNYTNQLIELPQFRLASAGGNIELSGSFAHPANNLQEGQVRFRTQSSQLQLASFHTVQEFKPGLAGTLEVRADGAATLRQGAPPLVSALNANLAARGLAVDRKPVGDVNASAQTRGQQVEFTLASN